MAPNRLSGVRLSGGRGRGARSAFTLIELMITIVIAAVVILAVYSMFLVQMRTYLSHDLQTELLSNLRFTQQTLQQTVGRTGGLFSSTGQAIGALGTDLDPYAGDVIGQSIPVGTSLEPLVQKDGGGPNGTDWLLTMGADPELVFFTKWEEGMDHSDPTEPSSRSTDHLYVQTDDLVGLWQAGPSASLLSYVGITERMARLGEGGYRYIICQNFASPTGAEAFVWEVDGGYDLIGGLALVPNTAYGDWNAGVTPDLPPVLACSGLAVNGFYVEEYGDDSVPSLMMAEDMMYDSTVGTSFWETGPDVDRDLPLMEHVLNFQVQTLKPAAEVSGDPSAPANWTDNVTQYTDTNNEQEDLQTLRMLRILVAGETSRDLPIGAVTNWAASNEAIGIGNGVGYDVTSTERMRRYLTFDVRLSSMPGARDLQ